MAEVPQWEWTQPCGGKVIKWKSLTVGQEMDIEANYRREEERHLHKYMLLAARIVSVDSSPKPLEMNELRTWESVDLEMFAEEVDLRESQRRAALMKNLPNTVVGLEKAAADAKAALRNLQKCIDATVNAAKIAEGAGPLAK